MSRRGGWVAIIWYNYHNTCHPPGGLVDNQSAGKWYSPRAHQRWPGENIRKNMWIFPHLLAVVSLHCFHHTNDVGLLQYGCIVSNGWVPSRINIDSKCKLSEGWATYITLFWGIYLWGLPARSIHTNDHYDVPYSNVPPCSQVLSASRVVSRLLIMSMFSKKLNKNTGQNRSRKCLRFPL